jgi:hypothetical protein
MESKDILLIVIAFFGWFWGIIQFVINRKHHNKDKQIDRKYEAYSAYMKKADELMNNLRNDPNMVYGIPTDFMRVAMTGDSEQINQALIQFNEKLLEYVKRASEPLMILKQELNSLLIICSDDLSIKINEFTDLTTDFNNEMQKSLSLISPNDSNEMIRQLQTLGQNERWKRYGTLNEEIIRLMRKEIGN